MIFLRAPLPTFSIFLAHCKVQKLVGGEGPPQPGQAGGASHHQLGQAGGGGLRPPQVFVLNKLPKKLKMWGRNMVDQNDFPIVKYTHCKLFSRSETLKNMYIFMILPSDDGGCCGFSPMLAMLIPGLVSACLGLWLLSRVK